jgi:hypothetical protein
LTWGDFSSLFLFFGEKDPLVGKFRKAKQGDDDALRWLKASHSQGDSNAMAALRDLNEIR